MNRRLTASLKPLCVASTRSRRQAARDIRTGRTHPPPSEFRVYVTLDSKVCLQSFCTARAWQLAHDRGEALCDDYRRHVLGGPGIAFGTTSAELKNPRHRWGRFGAWVRFRGTDGALTATAGRRHEPSREPEIPGKRSYLDGS